MSEKMRNALHFKVIYDMFRVRIVVEYDETPSNDAVIELARNMFPEAELCYVSMQFGALGNNGEFLPESELAEILKKDDIDESDLEKALESFDESTRVYAYCLNYRKKKGCLGKSDYTLIIASSVFLKKLYLPPSDSVSLPFSGKELDSGAGYECSYALESGVSWMEDKPSLFA